MMISDCLMDLVYYRIPVGSNTPCATVASFCSPDITHLIRCHMWWITIISYYNTITIPILLLYIPIYHYTPLFAIQVRLLSLLSNKVSLTNHWHMEAHCFLYISVFDQRFRNIIWATIKHCLYSECWHIAMQGMQFSIL